MSSNLAGAAKMSLLHRLPAEISQTMSASWLDLIDVARLDSAVCVHEERAAFLNTTFASKTVYGYSQYFDKERTRRGALFYKPEFQEWVLLRGVRLSSLASFPDCERVLKYMRAFQDIIRTSGTCLKTVQTDMDFDIIKVALYTHCSVLDRLKCGQTSKRAGLDRLLEACPSLQHLIFERTHASAMGVLQNFGNQIRSLRMATENKYLQERMQWTALVPHLPNLTELEVGRECPIDTVLTAVGQHCPHLRALNVTSYAYAGPDTGAAAMRAVMHGCPDLESLHVGGALHCDQSVWLELLLCCRKLTSLHFDTLASISEEFLTVLARDFPALRELELGAQDESQLAKHVASWPLLESLSVARETVTDELMYALAAHCPRLQGLTLLRSQAVTDAGVTALAQGCAQLQQLDLRTCDSITVAALEAIVTHCRYLERLNIQQPSCPNKITREQAEPYLQLKLGDINFYALLEHLAQREK